MLTRSFFAAVALAAFASPALACYGNSCPPTGGGGSTVSWGNFTGGGVVEGWTNAGNSGFGDTVNSFTAVQDEFGIQTTGTLVGDPNCDADCGDNTFSVETFSNQLGQSFVESISTGSGTVGTSAHSGFSGGVFNSGFMNSEGPSGM